MKKSFMGNVISIPTAAFVALAIAIAQLIVWKLPQFLQFQYYIACIAVAVIGIAYCLAKKQFDIDTIISVITALIMVIPVNAFVSYLINSPVKK